MKNANPVSGWVRGVVAGLALLAMTGCARGDAPGRAGVVASAPKTVADWFVVPVGGRPVRLQLAVTLPEMQQGLMGRRDLQADQGMLFVYERPQRMSFWMRNTPTPLDLGLFDLSGRLVEIYPLYPLDETPVASRSTELLFALEMNQGWFAEQGVKPGAQLDLKALAEALRARGVSPRIYGLLD